MNQLSYEKNKLLSSVFFRYNQLWNKVWIHSKSKTMSCSPHAFTNSRTNSNLEFPFFMKCFYNQERVCWFVCDVFIEGIYLLVKIQNSELEIRESMWWAGAHQEWTNYFCIYLILTSNVNWIYCKYTSRQNLLDQIFQIRFNIIFLAIRNKFFEICNNARTVIWVLIFLVWRGIGAKLNQAFFGFHFIPKDFQNIQKKVW